MGPEQSQYNSPEGAADDRAERPGQHGPHNHSFAQDANSPTEPAACSRAEPLSNKKYTRIKCPDAAYDAFYRNRPDVDYNPTPQNEIHAPPGDSLPLPLSRRQHALSQPRHRPQPLRAHVIQI